MGMTPEVQDYISSEIKGVLLQLQRRIDMQISQTEWRDPATVAQRQGTPMPPELIYAWTECLHFMQHPYLPVAAKRALYAWIRAKMYPRLGMYIKNMVPIDDMLKPYLDEYDLEVADVHLSPQQRADVIEAQKEEKKKKTRDTEGGEGDELNPPSFGRRRLPSSFENGDDENSVYDAAEVEEELFDVIEGEEDFED
jgi:hypothetical protein